MRQLDLKLADDQAKFDAAEHIEESAVLARAVYLYQRLGLIHPFVDANGRVARLAMNHLLQRYGSGYVIFPPLNEAPELMDALQEGHRGNMKPLENLAQHHTFRL